jgi:hypothetical protein
MLLDLIFIALNQDEERYVLFPQYKSYATGAPLDLASFNQTRGALQPDVQTGKSKFVARPCR